MCKASPRLHRTLNPSWGPALRLPLQSPSAPGGEGALQGCKLHFIPFYECKLHTFWGYMNALLFLFLGALWEGPPEAAHPPTPLTEGELEGRRQVSHTCQEAPGGLSCEHTFHVLMASAVAPIAHMPGLPALRATGGKTGSPQGKCSLPVGLGVRTPSVGRSP